MQFLITFTVIFMIHPLLITAAALIVFLFGGRVAESQDKLSDVGILVLDNCDDQYKGKTEYQDNLTLIDSVGKQKLRISGLNNCESIGSARLIAVDNNRECFWMIENVAHQLRRFDYSGKETLKVDGVDASAIAVDPDTGNVWVLTGSSIGNGQTVVYNDAGKLINTVDVSGWDIVYDPKSHAFWMADKKLTKVDARQGTIDLSVDISTWCASSLDVDQKSGAVWVAVRRHTQVAGSENRLLKFDTRGRELLSIDLQERIPFRVSVDWRDGSVWVAQMRHSIERFSADGETELTLPVKALAVQVDPQGELAWVVTPDEVQLLSDQGVVIERIKHVGPTSQAWIAACYSKKTK